MKTHKSRREALKALGMFGAAAPLFDYSAIVEKDYVCPTSYNPGKPSKKMTLKKTTVD